MPTPKSLHCKVIKNSATPRKRQDEQTGRPTRYRTHDFTSVASTRGAFRPRGPKPALSTDTVVDAAIEVADANPTTPLSMRMIGDHLGRTAMSLYTYIPGKDELLDLMYDRVHAELPPIADTGDWRMALSDWAAALFALNTRHPWTLDVSLARPVLGPHEQAGLESLLSILYSTSLDAPTIRRSVSMLFHFIRGSARP